ncbi:class GN sortase [Pseudomonadota bacterium]
MKAWCLGLLLLSAVWQLGEGIWIHAKALLAQQLLQHAWEQVAQGEAGAKPWPWADTTPLARLRVDRLKIDQIVLAGASGRTLAFGPGHVAGAALPGSEGNVVISGHRDTHFRFLQALKSGDPIELQLPDGDSIRYVVTHQAVYHQDDTWLLEETTDQQLTLITCYPFDDPVPGGPLRYVVTANKSL